MFVKIKAMSILIENPTAESLWRVVQQLPAGEIERLKELINTPSEDDDNEEIAWREASVQAARRFFEDEESA